MHNIDQCFPVRLQFELAEAVPTKYAILPEQESKRETWRRRFSKSHQTADCLTKVKPSGGLHKVPISASYHRRQCNVAPWCVFDDKQTLWHVITVRMVMQRYSTGAGFHTIHFGVGLDLDANVEVEAKKAGDAFAATLLRYLTRSKFVKHNINEGVSIVYADAVHNATPDEPTLYSNGGLVGTYYTGTEWSETYTRFVAATGQMSAKCNEVYRRDVMLATSSDELALARRKYNYVLHAMPLTPVMSGALREAWSSIGEEATSLLTHVSQRHSGNLALLEEQMQCLECAQNVQDLRTACRTLFYQTW